MGHIFFELTLIICLSAVLVVIFRILKQPVILAYILTGILIAPSLGLFPLESGEFLETMGELGITLLLFVLGLELRFSELRSIGKVALLVGFLQMIGTFVVGFLFALLLGFSLVSGVYIGLAVMFSSTIIAVKLLGDKKDLSSLYGKITVGILLAQDFVAIFTLIVLAGFQNSASGSLSLFSFVFVFIKAFLLFVLVYYFSRSIFPKIIDAVSRNAEALFLVSLAIAFGMAGLVSSPYIGFSIEIGGFLAGLALANSQANFQIVARVRALRDFFITLFFVFLGTQMVFKDALVLLWPAGILLLVVLFYKPLIILISMGVMGYRRRTSFMTAVTLAQVSEFSLIVVFLGNKLGHINETIVSLVTIVAVASFVLSNYMIMNANNLYKILLTYLEVFERKETHKERTGSFGEMKNHVILIGANRMGGSILKTFEKKGEDIIVVDFDPDVIKTLGEKEGIKSIFGDISDIEIQERASVRHAKLIVSTVSDVEDNLILLQSLQGTKAKVVLVAQNTDEAKRLYTAGADYVVLPHLVGGRHIANMLKGDNIDIIDDLKEKDKLFF